MKESILKTVLAGLTGGLVMNLAMLLTFGFIGVGRNGGGILLDPAVQSRKLIAIWTEIEPLPLVVSHPAPIVIGLILFAIGHAFIYRWFAPSWPTAITSRALRLATLVFFLSYLFWEFFTPFNQFGEPLMLIGLELVFWATISLAESLAIAAVMERKTLTTLKGQP